MRARFRQWFEDINDSFWFRPSLIVLSAIILAQFLIDLDHDAIGVPDFVARWLYSGGETGARTLLGAVAGSTIGVAGTVFSITIATLTLASTQMGPRLLRNFTRDRGNQITLGIYVGTFAYTLIVLRSIRGVDQGAFIPGMAITGAILLALLCVAMLIYFVNHVTAQINFDNVINLVYQDLRSRLEKVTADTNPPARIPDDHWKDGIPVFHEGGGYLQQLDEDLIADWAAKNNVQIMLDMRVGNYVFPGVHVAMVTRGTADASDILARAMALGPYPTPSGDLEYAVEQLVDIAMRALSSGINDPRTAARVLDRLGSILCVLATRRLPTGAIARNDVIVFQRTVTTYDGLIDAMFHTIRQSARNTPSVLIHMMDTLLRVMECEQDQNRRASILRHAELIHLDGKRDIPSANDRAALAERFEAVGRMALSSK